MEGETPTGGEFTPGLQPDFTIPGFGSDFAGPDIEILEPFLGPDPQIPEISALQVTKVGLDNLGIKTPDLTSVDPITGGPAKATPEYTDVMQQILEMNKILVENMAELGKSSEILTGLQTFGPKHLKNFRNILEEGDNNLSVKQLDFMEGQAGRLPAPKAEAYMTEAMEQYGMQSKNGFNPENWGAAEWISAAGLLASYLQNKATLKQSKDQFDRTSDRLDKEVAHRVSSDNAQLALNEAALAKKPNPGKGAKIGKTSIYS